MSSTLAEELAARIRREGRITFRDWMEAALYHPTLGYYNRADLKRWGREGDYRTSPERSELFAATFARLFVNFYDRLNRPAEFTIVEFGGGEGHFAAGVLECLEKLSSEVFASTKFVSVELSQDAQSRSAERLHRFLDRVEFAQLSELSPIRAGVVFSNELLDAFPVHRVTSVGGKLKELFVILDDKGDFVWQVEEPSNERLKSFCESEIPPLEEGQVVELNLAIDDLFKDLSTKILNGYLVTVDYGAESTELYSSPLRDKGTLRAFQRHGFVDDVLAVPGEYDITTTVDWTMVKNLGRRHGFESELFESLDTFLVETGALEELESRLISEKSESEKSRLTTAAREMILPTGMAAHFQVLIQGRHTA